MKNAFGLIIYDIKEVLEDRDIENYVMKTLARVLEHLGIPSKKSQQIIDKCISFAKNYPIEEYEKNSHALLEKEGITQEIPKKLTGRADLIFKQIKPYILPGSVLDLGCGDGKVGELCASEGAEVVLTDVYRNSNLDNINLKFKLFNQEGDVPFQENEFDNTLVLTVFHHSNNPLKTVREAYRVTKPNGRILVIESVYGVTGKELSPVEKEKAKNYLALSKEQQRKANIFFDHFYNRVIHYSDDKKTKVNVPFNFNSPDNWKKIFEKEGFEQEKAVHLGIDQPTVPEYHTLHILRVKK